MVVSIAFSTLLGVLPIAAAPSATPAPTSTPRPRLAPPVGDWCCLPVKYGTPRPTYPSAANEVGVKTTSFRAWITRYAVTVDQVRKTFLARVWYVTANGKPGSAQVRMPINAGQYKVPCHGAKAIASPITQAYFVCRRLPHRYIGRWVYLDAYFSREPGAPTPLVVFLIYRVPGRQPPPPSNISQPRTGRRGGVWPMTLPMT